MTDSIRAALKRLLSAVLDGLAHDDHPMGWARVDDAIDAARAALAAEPVAEGPTDEELTLTYAYAVAAAVDNQRGPFNKADAEAAQLAGLRAVLARYGHQPAPPAEGEPSDEELLELAAAEMNNAPNWEEPEYGYEAGNPFPYEAPGVAWLNYARAVLARYSHQPAPPATGEVAELVVRLRRASDGASAMGWEQDSWTIARAADLLAQRHPAPVPVSERLPGPEDCDAEGFCWWFSPADPSAGTFGVAACWVLRKYEPEDDFRTHWLPVTALPLPQGEVEP